jgi:heme exporter protein B
MINKILSILYKDFKIEINQSHLFFSVGLYVISSIYIIYISYQPTGILSSEHWVSIFWVIILFSSISAVSKSFFQESGNRNYYYYYVLSPDELIISKLIYNFLFIVFVTFLTFILFTFLLGNFIKSYPFFISLLLIGSLSISNCLTLISAIGHQVKNNSMLISILSFPVIIPILILLIKLSKISSLEFSWNLIQDDIYLLILLNIILVVLTKILFGFLWRN